MNKLFEIQQRVGAIGKDSTNPFFNSKYFDINKLVSVLKPVFNEVGVVVIQPLGAIDGAPAIETIVLDAETGDNIVHSITPLPPCHDPQKHGSAITYFRRYALQSLFFLESADDDGNMVSAATTAGGSAPFANKSALEVQFLTLTEAGGTDYLDQMVQWATGGRTKAVKSMTADELQKGITHMEVQGA